MSVGTGEGRRGSLRHFIPKHACRPIAKTFTRVALRGETRKQRAQLGLDLGIFHHIFPDTIEARASSVPAQPKLVTPRRFADESDFRHVGPRATVGTAGGSNDYFFAYQAGLNAKLFDPIDKTRQHTLRLSE